MKGRRKKYPLFKRGGGVQKVLPCLKVGGGGGKVSDSRFSHFVVPRPLPVINDQSLTLMLYLRCPSAGPLHAEDTSTSAEAITLRAEVLSIAPFTEELPLVLRHRRTLQQLIALGCKNNKLIYLTVVSFKELATIEVISELLHMFSRGCLNGSVIS